jgi:uncharacterized protein CbrC (UPF0167 family)
METLWLAAAIRRPNLSGQVAVLPKPIFEGARRMSEQRYCTQCQRTKPVTENGRWLTNKIKRWQCEWCAAKILKPASAPQQRRLNA